MTRSRRNREAYYGIDFSDDPSAKPLGIPTDSGLIDEGPGMEPEMVGLDETGPHQDRNRVSVSLYRIASLARKEDT